MAAPLIPKSLADSLIFKGLIATIEKIKNSNFLLFESLADMKSEMIGGVCTLKTPNGSVGYTFVSGDYSDLVNDITIVAVDQVLPSVGVLIRNRSSETISVLDYGADPTGVKSSAKAFVAAMAAGSRVEGNPGDVYLIDRPIVVPNKCTLFGNGASFKLTPGVIGFRLDNSQSAVKGWNIIGNGGLYAVLNTGKFNEFSDNICTGNIGHFYFSTNAAHVKAVGNKVLGLTADTEITTAIVAESCQHVLVNGNQFENIPVGWAVQIRNNTSDFNVSDNTFVQKQYSDPKIATAGQKVFVFNFEVPCFLRKIQINGKPLSTGYTVSAVGSAYTVTFNQPRTAGEIVKLVGYRGAENIQTNSGSNNGTIEGNSINGTADTGIIVHGSRITVANNVVRNCGYAGIAIYGDQDCITVSGNIVADCAQMDDAMSSPDFPELPSVFAGAILASGNTATIVGNTIINDSGTMRYGIRFNKSDMTLRVDGSSTMSESGNVFSGTFVDGTRYAPNDTFGRRLNSISIDGPSINYPDLNLDQAWGTTEVPYPPNTPYFLADGTTGTRATRDPVTRRGGVASLRTVAGQYIDFGLSSAEILFNTNVKITFWAKSNGGENYFRVFTRLRGLREPLTVRITDENWKMYSISFPFNPNLDPEMILRFEGVSESANFQHIQISGVMFC